MALKTSKFVKTVIDFIYWLYAEIMLNVRYKENITRMIKIQ